MSLIGGNVVRGGRVVNYYLNEPRVFITLREYFYCKKKPELFRMMSRKEGRVLGSLA